MAREMNTAIAIVALKAKELLSGDGGCCWIGSGHTAALLLLSLDALGRS